jgi:hypothetical protein
MVRLSRIAPIILVAVCLMGANAAQAQTAATEGEAGVQSVFPTNVFGIGLSASLCSGMGLSFRQHFAYTPLAYQLTGGVWKTHTISMYDFGASIQYDLTLSNTYRLYALMGAGYYYYGDSTNELKSPGRFGLGVGYEIPFSKSIAISADIMISLFEPSGDILPLPSIGMLVFFK